MLLKSIGKQVLAHKRLAAAGLGSTVAAAAAAGTALIRRRSEGLPTLPDPASHASITAVAVHNAAKGAVIASTRESKAPDVALVLEAVRRVVIEASTAGADIVPAAIGAVEGTVSLAHLVDVSPRRLGEQAAGMALEESARIGVAAAARMQDALSPYLSGRDDSGAYEDEPVPGVSPG